MPVVQPSPAARSLRRVSFVARASGLVLIILGGLSALLNILQPLSSGFLISVLALGCGVVEWRKAGRLAARDASAPRGLARNQLVLGAGILVYGLWQAYLMTPELVLATLQQPELKPVMELLPAEQVKMLHELLPPVIRLMYLAVGVLGGLGCVAMAWYYSSRQRLLRKLAEETVGA